jgi:WXG100 family type VII secretion target
MSDFDIRVEHGRLDTCASEANACSTSMTNKFSQVKDHVHTLFNDWEGPDQQAYNRLQGKWDEAAAAMAQVLKDISDLVTRLNGVYRKAETDMAGDWPVA